MSAPSPARVRSVYRNLVRWGARFPQYNFREFALRRTRESFEMNRSAEGARATELLEDAERELLVLQRQVKLSSLYPSEHTVVDGKH